MRATQRLAAGIVVLLLAVACQPLPRPFESDRRALSLGELASMGPMWGLIVAPVTEAPADSGAALAVRTAAALRERGIAASDSGRTEGRYVLQGQALATEAGGTASVSLLWTLRDPRGGVYARTSVAQRVDAAAWRRSDQAVLDGIALASAAELAPLIDRGGDAEAAGVPMPAAAPRVHLWPVDGAPGDGRQALAVALAAALDLRGIRLAPEDAEAPIVTASVTVEPTATGDRLAIRWSVLRPDGEEIGTVEQANEVPRGRLDDRWGPLAFDIAAGAAEGLEDLLRSAPQAGPQAD